MVINYLKHLLLNWNVALNALILFIFHLLHGLIPISLTDHNFLGIKAWENDE
jgi:hypothetical protein